MTSNAGVREISRDSRLGFGSGTGIMSFEEIEASALSELKRFLNPEFINRIDEIVIFRPLDLPQIEAILDIQLEELSHRLAPQVYTLDVSPDVRKILINKGWDPKFGGRPLRRAIQKELEDPLSVLLLENEAVSGSSIFVREAEGKIVFEVKIAEPAVIGNI
jgi:ATP-dependent Clp protease ATP-binding subunit ClpC